MFLATTIIVWRRLVGRIDTPNDPDGEVLAYGYDNGGLLREAYGTKRGNKYVYIKSLSYDEFEQRKRIEYGNGVTTTYDYDLRTRRLSRLLSVLPAGKPGSRTIQDIAYEYDLVGNILGTNNTAAIPAGGEHGGPTEQHFTYDDLYQLRTANGWHQSADNKKTTYTNSFTYDIIGNITQKVQAHSIVHGTDPLTDSATQPRETNYILDYKYTGSQPHAVTDAGDKLYAYDLNGNMTGWTSKTSGQKRIIVWNEENRVQSIADGGSTTVFLYDDSGERAVKRGQHGESVYVNRFYSVKNGDLGSKHIFAGETRVVTKLEKDGGSIQSGVPGSIALVRSQGIQNAILQGNGQKKGINRRLTPSDGTGTVNPPIEKFQFFYHGDHLGSSSFITDDAGAVYQHLEYFPYGESWVEEGGSGQMPYYRFTGKELDPETGLYYYGARYYDPVLSTWLSPDPALSKYLDRVNGDGIRHSVLHPITLALYSYAGLNPVKYVDPSGEELAYVVFSDPHVFTSTESHPMWDTKVVSNVINVVAAAKQQGIPLKITSGYRTSAYQKHLNDLYTARNQEAKSAVKAAVEKWEKGGKKGPEPNAEKIRAKIMKGLGRPAAVDRSPHQSAFALDMNWRELGEMGKKDKKDYQGMMKKILEKEGFHQLNPLPKDELQHWEQDPTKSGYKTKDAAVQENKASFKAFEELGVAKDKYEK